ncbi:Hypothetical predicted protein [Cloeon dipterum]|uniref:SHSP domain-containing protein n=1 Tax=Cloeon dipterum TaxID=197152 RepID=A0A8S1C3G1_9INSE|nr:Hypothetical predicted protein [Cloeon dipterum]
MTTVTDLPSLLEDMMKPSSSLFDEDFDLNLLKNDEVLRALMPTHGVTTLRCANFQKRRFSDKTICDESNLPTVDTSGFHVNVDMKAFKEEEIVVKTSGNQLIVEGKQEEVQGAKGTLRRHFVRRYVIPEQVDLEKVECRLTEDGFLAVNVPLKETVPSIAEEERVIPIISAKQDNVEKPERDAEKEEPAEEGEDDHEEAQE